MCYLLSSWSHLYGLYCCVLRKKRGGDILGVKQMMDIFLEEATRCKFWNSKQVLVGGMLQLGGNSW